MGASDISELARRQRLKSIDSSSINERKKLIHITRMWPKRETELLDGGSLYWVFKGLILARQEILGLEEIIGSDEIKRCGIILNEQIVKTVPKAKRAFQGWRYLDPNDAPRDSEEFSITKEELPHFLQLELSKLGVQ